MLDILKQTLKTHEDYLKTLYTQKLVINTSDSVLLESINYEIDFYTNEIESIKQQIQELETKD